MAATGVSIVTTPTTSAYRRALDEVPLGEATGETLDDDDVYVEDDSSTRGSVKRNASADSDVRGAKKYCDDSKLSERASRHRPKAKKRSSKFPAATPSRPGVATFGARDLFRVEDTLCVHIPVSDGNEYIDNVANADLNDGMRVSRFLTLKQVIFHCTPCW